LILLNYHSSLSTQKQFNNEKNYILSLYISILNLVSQRSGFVSLFDGENLAGWSEVENLPPLIEDGLIKVKRPYHLFYDGKLPIMILNFELRLANDAWVKFWVYLFTTYHKGWPNKGYEVQQTTNARRSRRKFV
jgi:hypothetical protein